MEQFILELGAGFTFVARQKRMTVDNTDYYLDLLFYHRKLKRLVAIDLKIGKFKPAYKGQMELYLRWLEKYEKEEGEQLPVGLILCAEGNHEQIELLQLDKANIKVAEYISKHLPKELLAEKLHKFTEIAKKHWKINQIWNNNIMTDIDFKNRVTALIDSLKSISANCGLGNDGNEFKIITQVFLYKFMNDKFAYQVKQIEPRLAEVEHWEKELSNYSDDDYEMLLLQLGADTAKLKPEHFISNLFDRQNESDFSKLFDDTLMDIAISNNNIFSVKTDGGAKVQLFERITNYISDPSKRDAFAKAIINKIVTVNFEHIFTQKYDFYATIFEYLIKDYNKDSGGKYAEYYTPHAVAKIMAAILVNKPVQNVTVYDPIAGSGTLLMSIAHAIGEDKCTIYSQDISQKSSSLLRLNLILNNLFKILQNICR